MTSIKKLSDKLRAHKNIQSVSALVVVLVIALVGAHLLVGSHAQSPYGVSNASEGNLGVGASLGNDTNTSSGKYVQFGAPPPTIRVANNQLVNASGNNIRLLGVDADNTEFCTRHHTVADANPLDNTEAQAIASWHINAVRVPLNEDCWLGINGATINGESVAESAQTYQTAIENWVTDLNNNGIIAVLDMQWEAPGNNSAQQQWPMADKDNTPNFWTSIAKTFKSNHSVMFDLINEPFLERTNVTLTPTTPGSSTSPWDCWLNGCNVTFTPTAGTPPSPPPAAPSNTPVTYAAAGMQQLVNTVRATGANQPIILGGLNEASDPCGIGTNTSTIEPTNDKDGSTAACTELANLPTDPDKQLVIDFHNYQYGPCYKQACWDTTLGALNSANIPLITDEFGEEDCSGTFMNTYESWADQHNVSYLAWSWNVPPAAATQPLDCPATEGNGNNFYLLADWNGTPSTLIPQGTEYKAHLLAVNP